MEAIRDAERRLVVDAAATVERIGSGFGFIEGPVWSDDEALLVFSDIPGNRMWAWDEVRGFRRYREPSNMANGNAFDLERRLITCEHATSHLVRRESDGSTTVLASAYRGRALNSPNDVVVAQDGSMYFTDPTYGRQEGFGVPREPVLGFQGLYRLQPHGELELLADDFAQPNGLCFSAGENVLYVNDTERMIIRSFDVGDTGDLSGGGVWAEIAGDGPGGPDGMKIDKAGNVYCSGPGGIHVLGVDGSLCGVIPVPEMVGNFAWGGRAHTTLFICASTSLFRLETEVPGA
jgi:gluconolactonase